MKTIDEFTTKTNLDVLIRVTEDTDVVLLMIDGEVFPMTREDATRLGNSLIEKEG